MIKHYCKSMQRECDRADKDGSCVDGVDKKYNEPHGKKIGGKHMNSKKQRELLIENGELQIRNRALSDRLAATDTKLKNQTVNLAVLLVAFKQYIRQTHAGENAPLSDDDVLAILNKQVAEAAKQFEVTAQKETAQ